MRIRPSRDVLAEPWWQGLAAGRLLLQRCTRCGAYRHPPGPICAQCHSFDHDWTPASGGGTLYSYTVSHHVAHAAFAAQVPYVIALVDLDEGVRMVSAIKDAARETLAVGMRLACRIEQLSPGFALPYFVPASASPNN